MTPARRLMQRLLRTASRLSLLGSRIACLWCALPIMLLATSCGPNGIGSARMAESTGDLCAGWSLPEYELGDVDVISRTLNNWIREQKRYGERHHCPGAGPPTS